MKSVIITVLVFVAFSEAGKPSFRWLSDRSSDSGVPLLKVTFPDGKHIDYIHFKQYNPIPKQSFEKDDEIDPCIFEGYLENEPEAYAVLTGGCPTETSFEVQFKSNLLDDYLFKVVDDEVEVVQPPFQTSFADKFGKTVQKLQEDGIQVPGRQQVPPLAKGTTKANFPSAGLILRLAMRYDQSFLTRFGTNSLNKMRAVVAQAQPMYYWPSLTVRIRLNVITEGSISQSILADDNGLNTVGPMINDSTINSNVFLCSNNDQAGVVGLAWLGSVCDVGTNFYKTAIVEYFVSDLITGQIMAHEVGHSLGMSHDFNNGNVSDIRYSSNGTLCTGVGGVMDYYGSVTLWSTCSVEDFLSYYNYVTPFCMATDSAGPTTVAPATTTTTTTTKSATTTTTTKPTTTTTTTKPTTTTTTTKPTSTTTTTKPSTTTTTTKSTTTTTTTKPTTTTTTTKPTSTTTTTKPTTTTTTIKPTTTTTTTKPTTTTTTTKPTTTTTTTKPTTTTTTTKLTTTTTTTTTKPTTTTTTTTTKPTTTTTTTKPTTATTTTTTVKGSTTTTKSSSGVCKCGGFNLVTNPAGRATEDQETLNRIVGGFIAPAHSIPYQVGIWTTTSGNPFCGGTLISPNYVLTAAHCMVYSASEMRVAVGDVDFSILGDGEVFYPVATALTHNLYNDTTQDFDFALLKLATPVPVSSSANYACLPPDTTQTFVGTPLVISGWGTTSSGGSQSAPLKAAYISGISNLECSNDGYGTGITSNMICATTNPINTDTCQGDSGGPLAGLVNGKVTVVGVTSFGVGCAQAPYPGVYSRVTAQKAWILANSDAGSCQN